MSQYLEIYMKVKEDYIPLAIYGSSSRMYHYFDKALFIPYGNAEPYAPDCFQKVINLVKEDMINLEKEIKSYDEKIKLVQGMEGSVREKFEMIEEIELMKKEYLSEENLEEIKKVITFCEAMLMIADENHSYYETPIKDIADMFYIGIECGNPGAKNTEGYSD